MSFVVPNSVKDLLYFGTIILAVGLSYGSLNTKVDSIITGQSSNKEELRDTKAEVREVRGEVADLRSDVNGIKQVMEEWQRLGLIGRKSTNQQSGIIAASTPYLAPTTTPIQPQVSIQNKETIRETTIVKESPVPSSQISTLHAPTDMPPAIVMPTQAPLACILGICLGRL